MKKRLPILLLPVLLILVAAAGGLSCGKKETAGKPPSTSPPASTPAPGEGTNTTGLPLTMAPGVSISTYATDLGGPRVIAWDPNGVMLVSIPSRGLVVALPDRDNNGVADGVAEVVGGLNGPHGIAFSAALPGKIYIAEEDAVAVYDYDATNLKAVNRRKIIDLPSGGAHVTRTIMFLPPPNDTQLLISVGSSVNAGPDGPLRAKILVANADGSGLRDYAVGLRNSVFMAFFPPTKGVWATEMGRDNLGDNTPPDEVNIIEDGHNYGWPYFYGKNVRDDTVSGSARLDPAAMTPSHIDLQAHSAPLGLDFFSPDEKAPGYANNLLIAYHGSWNRSVPTGYKVVRFRLDEKGNVVGSGDLVAGWLQPDGSVLGRPAGLSIRDGVVYVSDDRAGVIYRITLKD